eukprot:g6438.t1
MSDKPSVGLSEGDVEEKSSDADDVNRDRSDVSVSRVNIVPNDSDGGTTLSRITTEELSADLGDDTIDSSASRLRSWTTHDQKKNDVLDLVKHGIITKAQGDKLIEEYEDQDKAKQRTRRELLKRKVMKRQNTTERNIAEMVKQGQLTVEEAKVILEDMNLGNDNNNNTKKGNRTVNRSLSPPPKNKKSRDNRRRKKPAVGMESLSEKTQEPSEIPSAKEDFVAASRFQGAKTGYLYQQGPKGLGYYKDIKKTKRKKKSSRKKEAKKPPTARLAVGLARQGTSNLYFIPQPNKEGEIQGFVHRNGPQGIGYYKIKDPYLPSAKYDGSKDGYVYQKNGLFGSGYYLDNLDLSKSKKKTDRELDKQRKLNEKRMKPPFVPAAKFTGAKADYLYKKDGPYGAGYYRDDLELNFDKVNDNRQKWNRKLDEKRRRENREREERRRREEEERQRREAIETAARLEKEKIVQDAIRRLDFCHLRSKSKFTKRGLLCLCIFLLLGIYCLVVLPTSFSYVDIDEFGIRIDRYSGAIIDAEKIYLPGRYRHGGFQDFIRYKSKVMETHLFVDGAVYEGQDLTPYQIGKYANNVYGPVTARASGGELYDVEVTLYYQINSDTLIELHRYYGSYKQVNESIYDDVRFTVRNVLSSHTIEDMLSRRIEVEHSLNNALKALIEKRKLTFVTLNVGRIVMSQPINKRLYTRELNTKKVDKVLEESMLLNITKYTEYLIKVAIGEKESYLAVREKNIDNNLLIKQRSIDKIHAITDRKVAVTKRNIMKNATVDYFHRTNDILNKSLAYLEFYKYKELDVASIDMEVLKLKALNEKEKVEILSPAILFKHVNITMANYYVEKLKAENYVAIYNQLRSSIGANRIKLLNLEWVKKQMNNVIENNKKFNFDTQLPSKFEL